jgi:pimeloyl-ACP methyl ester carboxylesterase
LTTARPPRLEGTVRLDGDRRLGYAEYGPAEGRPLLWFHGTPGARRQISPEARAATHERDVRLISVERPGIGDSTPHRYDAIVEWAADLERVCDALGVDRFGVAGLSGGGPYALACAHEMPSRVVAAALLGGVAPAIGKDAADGGPSTAARLFSPLLRHTHAPLGHALRGLVRALEPFGEQAIALFARMMPPGDKRLFEDEGIRRMFQDDIIEGSRVQMQSVFLDAALFGRHWGFELGDVRVPVHLFYGDADNIVPVEHGEHIAKRLPYAVLRIRADEGHLGGLGATHEIFDAIFAHWDDDPR